MMKSFLAAVAVLGLQGAAPAFECPPTAKARAHEFVEGQKSFRLGFLPTERSNPITATLEEDFKRSCEAGVACLQRADRQVAITLRHSLVSPEFRSLVDAMERSLRTPGGRIVFSGCGATGRESILLESMWRDFFARRAAELSAEERRLADRVVSIMTAGDFALIKSVEFFEDYWDGGARQTDALGVGKDDVFIAINGGGECSTILGSIERAVQRGAKGFMNINNPKELLRKIERSRIIIDDPRVTTIDLYCGSMALAGSTRMQSTTSQQLLYSAALEHALARLLPRFAKELNPDYAQGFEDLLSALEAPEARNGIAEAIRFESGVYAKGGRITYLADDCMLDLFTDNTERSPTFMLPQLKSCEEKALVQSWAFVKNPLYSTHDCWERMLRRAPRCLDGFSAADAKAMGMPQRVVDNPPRIGRADLEKFIIGNEPSPERIEGFPRAVAVTLALGEPPADYLAAADRLAAAWPERVRFCIGRPSSAPAGSICVRMDIADSPLEMWKHLAVKLVFNNLSTGTMALTGRIAGNYMSWVSISNKKLTDRGIRLLRDLGHISYEEAAERLFAAQEWVEAQDWAQRERPSAVQVALKELRGEASRSNRDALVPVSLRDVRIAGHVAAVQDLFFRERIFSEYARTNIWREAREAFIHPDDDLFNLPSGMWKGEYWGKLMISACRAAAYSGNADLKAFLHAEGLRLIACQRPDGYLGTYVDPEWVTPMEREKALKLTKKTSDWNWNLWCRKYTLWGLLACYRLTGDRALLAAADRAMAHQIAMLKRLGFKLADTGTGCMRGLPPCSILKPLLWLYAETGKAEYLDYAKEIYGYWSDPTCRAPQFAAKLATGRPIQDWYPAENGRWGKAYEMMSCLAGVVEYYRVTGDRGALELAKGMRERIRADELNLCLSVGYNDQFWGAKRQLNGVSEPCDAVHWMRLNHELWLVTGEAKYVDAIEETFYNAFLAAVRPDGKWGARVVRSHGRHQPAPPQSGMVLQHCCVNNMPRGFMDVAQTVAAKDAEGVLHVALYHDASAAFGGDKVAISGNFPVGKDVRVAIDRASAGKVRFRMPPWCRRLDVGGGGRTLRVTTPGWFEVEAPAGRSEWRLAFDMNPRIVDSDRAAVDGYDRKSHLFTRWASGSEKDLVPLLRTTPAAQVMWGPLLLAKSVRLGEGEDEILSPETVNGSGCSLSVTPLEANGVWGAWRLDFGKDGATKSIKACDYPSAATWEGTGVEFSTFF